MILKNKRHAEAEKLRAIDLELLADTLKERIYASLALLAVLVSIDPVHTSAGYTEVLIGGTALSLWLASWISTHLAQSVVFGRAVEPDKLEREKQRHAPLLLTAILPMILVGMAGTHVFSLETALSISIFSIILALIAWALTSARRMHTSPARTIILASAITLVGFGIVLLKVFIGH